LYKIKKQMSREANKANPLETAEVFLDPNQFKEEAQLDSKTQNWSESGRYLLYSVRKKGSDWQ